MMCVSFFVSAPRAEKKNPESTWCTRLVLKSRRNLVELFVFPIHALEVSREDKLYQSIDDIIMVCRSGVGRPPANVFYLVLHH